MNLSISDARETTRVVIDVCGQEKKYNTYYAEILLKMIEDDPREVRLTTCLMFKDVTKELGTARRAKNLGLLAGRLVCDGRVDFMYSFRDVDFLNPSEEVAIFGVYLFSVLFRDWSDTELAGFAQRLCKDRGFVDELLAFLGKFVAGWKGNVKGSEWRRKYLSTVRLLEKRAP